MKLIICYQFALVLSTLNLVTYLAFASDPDPLQDFCIAMDYFKKGYHHDDDYRIRPLFVNGKFCKDPKKVESEDFICDGENSFTVDWNLNETIYDVNSCPALNTMGVAASKGTFGPRGGYVPPHYHPRASEILICNTGKLFTIFKTTSATYVNIIRAGEALIVPHSMIHFVINLWKEPADYFVPFSSQNSRGIFINQKTYLKSVNLKDIAEEFSLDKDIVEMMQKILETDE